MENLKVKNRDLVVPGELLAEGDYLLGEGTFSKGNKIYAKVLGLVDSKEKFIKIIPLSGRYIPQNRDLVVGVITDIAFSSWYVDLNSPYTGVLTVANATERFIDLNEENISKIYDVGDVIVSKVANVSRSLVVGLTMKDRGLFKLNEGRLITISPTKVPRIIGKKGTMVQMLKDLTGCKITVGQNGRVWINGENPDLAIEAIGVIEKEAHTAGLTDKIREFLESKSKKKITKTEVKETKPETKPEPKPVKVETKPEIKKEEKVV